MSLGTVSITSALLRGIAEGVEQVTNPRYSAIIIIILTIIIIYHRQSCLTFSWPVSTKALRL